MKKLFANLDSKNADLIVVENGSENEAISKGYSEVEPVFGFCDDKTHCLVCAYVCDHLSRVTFNYLNKETFDEITSVIKFPNRENSKFYNMMMNMINEGC